MVAPGSREHAVYIAEYSTMVNSHEDIDRVPSFTVDVDVLFGERLFDGDVGTVDGEEGASYSRL